MVKAAYKTRQQELLLSYLRETKGVHFTAEDVRRHFAEKDISLGVATIYRQLEKLVSEGQVQKYFIDEHSASCFEYTGENSKNGTEAHFHLKCEKCGELFHVECDELSEITDHLETEHGFHLNPFRTVLYGICDKCGKETELFAEQKSGESK
ncbi:MAG: transcriptional repressor [Treponema sp.]|nr:transcriptional repressor [Treponema sp.]